jgi:ABC-type glycerol-3-phosphate transport system substrate-binding protein
MKKALIVVLLALFAFTMAFANGDQEESEGSGASGGVTSLRTWKYGGPQHEREYMLEKIAVFEEQNPAISIEWIYQNYAERRTQVITAANAGNLPELILSDGQSIPEFVELGILQTYEDLAPELLPEWRSRFAEEAWDTGVYDGMTYGVSTYVDAATMIAYNTAMFEEAGIVDSDGAARPPRDWDEVLEIAEQFKAQGMAGIALPGSNAPNDVLIFQGIAYRNGGRWIQDGEVTVDGPGFVDTLQFYQDLTPYAQTGFSETNFRQAMELFFQEQAPMAITMSYAPILRQSLGAPADFPYSIAPFPKNANDTGEFDSASFIMTPTTTFMVPEDVAEGSEDSIVTFVDYWMSEDAQEGWSGTVIEGRLPIMISNLNSPDFARVYPDLAASWEAGALFEGALPMPGFAGLAESEQLLIQVFQSVLLGIEEPRAGLSRIAPQIQSIYDAAQ